MITLTDKQIQEILNHKVSTEKGVNKVLKMTLNAIMYAEEHTLLQEQKKTANKSYITCTNSYGKQLAFTIPRDDLGVFKPLIMFILKKETAEMDRLCYELYTRGFSTSKVKDILKKVYREKYDQVDIFNLEQSFKEELEAWRSKTLDSRYLVVYLLPFGKKWFNFAPRT